MGPQPSIAVIAAALRNEGVALAAMAAEIAWANEPLAGILQNPDIFAQLNIQLEKIRIAAAGYCRPGPTRSPYDECRPTMPKRAVSADAAGPPFVKSSRASRWQPSQQLD
jgi:hypothetical protein